LPDLLQTQLQPLEQSPVAITVPNNNLNTITNTIANTDVNFIANFIAKMKILLQKQL